MIQKIFLRNFKSYEDEEFNIAPLTLIAGINGMGKSSILQSLLMLKQSYDVDYLNKGEKQIRLNGHFVNLENSGALCYAMAPERNVSISIDTEIGNHKWTIEAQDQAETNPPCTYEGGEYKSMSLFSDTMEFLTAERVGPRYEYRIQSDKAYNTKLGIQGELTPAYLYQSLQKNEEIGMDDMQFVEGGHRAIDKQLINNVNAWMSWIMLQDANKAAQKLNGGCLNSNLFQYKASPEHQQRRTLPEMFITFDDGKTRNSEWHLRYTPGCGRIHFSADESDGHTIYVGHIDEKNRCTLNKTKK